MAKYARIFENGQIKHELTFNGEKFYFIEEQNYCFINTYGLSFEKQISKKFGIAMEELEGTGLGCLWCIEDYEALDILKNITKLEDLQ